MISDDYPGCRRGLIACINPLALDSYVFAQQNPKKPGFSAYILGFMDKGIQAMRCRQIVPIKQKSGKDRL